MADWVAAVIRPAVNFDRIEKPSLGSVKLRRKKKSTNVFVVLRALHVLYFCQNAEYVHARAFV
jgi:hypothetical protein